MNKKWWMHLLALLTICFLVSALTGCGSKTKQTSKSKDTAVKTNVSMVKGFSSISMVNLMEKNEKGKAANNYQFSVATAPDEVMSKLVTQEIDIAAVPTNMAASLYQKTKGNVVMLAVNTLGVVKVVTTDPSIKRLEDLKGKSVVGAGQGAIPEYTFNDILAKKGLKPQQDIQISYKPGHEEVASLISSNQVQIATLPEPTLSQVMATNKKVRVIADLNTEWEALHPNTIMAQGCVVVTKKFLEKHPQAVTRFMKEYQASAQKVHSDLQGTSTLCDKFNIIPEKVAKTAIPKSHQVFVTGKEAEKKLTPFFKVLYEANPKSVGGAVPDSAFYYQPK